jgi:hypothetical protein
MQAIQNIPSESPLSFQGIPGMAIGGHGTILLAKFGEDHGLGQVGLGVMWVELSHAMKVLQGLRGVPVVEVEQAQAVNPLDPDRIQIHPSLEEGPSSAQITLFFMKKRQASQSLQIAGRPGQTGSQKAGSPIHILATLDEQASQPNPGGMVVGIQAQCLFISIPGLTEAS